jgi:hypothetical protein
MSTKTKLRAVLLAVILVISVFTFVSTASAAPAHEDAGVDGVGDTTTVLGDNSPDRQPTVEMYSQWNDHIIEWLHQSIADGALSPVASAAAFKDTSLAQAVTDDGLRTTTNVPYGLLSSVPPPEFFDNAPVHAATAVRPVSAIGALTFIAAETVQTGHSTALALFATDAQVLNTAWSSVADGHAAGTLLLWIEFIVGILLVVLLSLSRMSVAPDLSQTGPVEDFASFVTSSVGVMFVAINHHTSKEPSFHGHTYDTR